MDKEDDKSTIRAVLIKGRGPNFATAIESLMGREENPQKRRTVFFAVTALNSPLQGLSLELDVRVNGLIRTDETPDKIETLFGLVTQAFYKDRGGHRRKVSCSRFTMYDYDCVTKTAGLVIIDF
jgi:hypothetical protein